MPNRTIKGFRWIKGNSSSGTPAIEEGVVASAYATAIYEGVPVKRADDGTFQVAAAGDTNIYGICCGINQYYDSCSSRVVKPLAVSPKATW